ncbi:MAG: DUF4493 domain-containing protein [Bacteroidales bacterium]|nr:DUF4493 domain-containing protein [Bacteroidales bacterium]
MIAALSLSLGVVSCGDESSSLNSSTGTGRIKPLVQIDGSLITATGAPESRANDDVHVTVTDLKLKLTSDDGSFSQEWENVNDFDESQEFKVGDYTLEAYYGDENDAEGFSKPHYHGQQTITVKYDNTTEVALSAEMKNSRVKVRYTEAFTSYMTSYYTTLVTPKNNFVRIPSDEVNPVYVLPGEVTLNLTFTTSDGKSSTIEVARFDAKAKTEHVVTLDLAGGDAGADAILKVNFDDTVNLQNIEINLSADITDYPVPEITTEGWTSGDSFSHIEFSKATEQVKANITAAGIIDKVMLYTTSPTLNPEGWPEAIDLTEANSAEQALLTGFGLKARGVWNKPDKMAVIDFTDVFTHLGVGAGQEESTHTFKLQVVDTYGQLSEEMEFSVIVTPLSIIIVSADAVIGRTAVNAEVTYNGSQNLEDVIFQKRNLNSGVWETLTVNKITPVTGKEGTYTLNMTAPAPIEKRREVRALTYHPSYPDNIDQAIERSKLYLDVSLPPFEIITTRNDWFAHRAYLTIKCEEADDALVARNITSITVNGVSHEGFDAEGAEIEISDLEANTQYTVVVSGAKRSATATLTTESEQHLKVWNSSSKTVGFPTDNWHPQKLEESQYLWTIDGWATLNELTTSEAKNGIWVFGTNYPAYRATSGTIPANGRSSLSTKQSGGSEGHTAGEADIHDPKLSHGGTNAALIRTIGWGKDNTAKASGGDNAGFNTCSNMTQGELYLGSYSNGPQYGVDFASRPSGLSFWYHYDAVNDNRIDYGTAEVTIMTAAGDTIAHESAKLYNKRGLEKDNYYVKQTLELSYPKGAPTAGKLSIVFRSTTPDALYKKENNGASNPALQKDTQFWRTPGSTNLHGGEYVGSELYIDDVSLIY